MRKQTAFFLLIASILLTTAAQLLMKTGVLALETQALDWSALDQLLTARRLTAFALIGLGLGCYGLSMVAWIGVLTRIDLSIAYPFLSVSYVLVYLGAIALPWLNESFSLLRLAGILLICIGLIMITRSRKPSS